MQKMLEEDPTDKKIILKKILGQEGNKFSPLLVDRYEKNTWNGKK